LINTDTDSSLNTNIVLRKFRRRLLLNQEAQERSNTKPKVNTSLRLHEHIEPGK